LFICLIVLMQFSLVAWNYDNWLSAPSWPRPTRHILWTPNIGCVCSFEFWHLFSLTLIHRLLFRVTNNI
jgi:hypothetical protein